MGYPSRCSGDSIGAIIGVKNSDTLQVTRDDGSFDNDIFMEKEDGEGGRLTVYYSCWDAL